MAVEPGQILSLLSHELRSPLGVVRGYLRLLDQHQTELSANHRLAVSAALKATERSLELLAQASALGQMWRGESNVARRPLHLNDLLPALAQPVKDAEDAAAVAVNAVPDRWISGDRALLHAALSSLVTSVHRAQPLAVSLSVSWHDERVGDRDGVAIHIAPEVDATDNAADTPLDLRRGGLGLDLPMAVAIVDAHEGRIRERRTARGTSVAIWLPVTGPPKTP